MPTLPYPTAQKAVILEVTKTSTASCRMNGEGAHCDPVMGSRTSTSKRCKVIELSLASTGIPASEPEA